MVRGRCHAPADREDDPLRYRHGSGYVVTADIEDIYARWDDDTGPIEATEGFVQQLLLLQPSQCAVHHLSFPLLSLLACS